MSRVFVATESSLGRQVVIKVLPPELAASLSAGPVPPRDPARRVAPASPYRAAARRRRGRPTSCSTPCRWSRASRSGPARARRRAAGGRGRADPARRGGRAELRPPARRGAPGHQARQRAALRRPRAGDRLRRRQGAGPGAPVVAHQHRPRARHAGLHGARAGGRGPAHRPPGRHLRARRRSDTRCWPGRPPFTAPTAQAVVAAHMLQPPAPLAQLRPSVPPALAALLMRCLEKRPADRWQSAAEMLHARSRRSARPDQPPATARQRTRPRPARRAGRPLGAAHRRHRCVGWLTSGTPRGAAPLDADLVAVAPFDVPDARLALWREGLVDVLSRNLDGAGPVRSVPPTTVIRRWSGRADRPSAAELGRRTGAQARGVRQPDRRRARLRAAHGHRARRRRTDARWPRSSCATRPTGWTAWPTRSPCGCCASSGRTRRIEVFRATAMGSTSLPALKAFLRGEQWFRRASWDSALASYEPGDRARQHVRRSPLWRSGKVLGWSARRRATRFPWRERCGRARLTHGLAPRDSLLLTADSVLAEAVTRRCRAWRWSAIRRVHAIAEDLTRRYPDDAESWYVLGRGPLPLGPPVGRTPARGARGVRPRHPARLRVRAMPTSTRSTLGSGSTAPRRAIAMPTRYLALAADRTPRRRASAWRTSSWQRPGYARGSRQRLLRAGVALGSPGRAARPGPGSRLRRRSAVRSRARSRPLRRATRRGSARPSAS